MTYFLIALLACSFFLIKSNHPMKLILIILLISLFFSIESFMSVKNPWMTMVLMLAFVGGLMVLYLFVISLSSNEKKKSSSSKFFYFFLIIFFFSSIKSEKMTLLMKSTFSCSKFTFLLMTFVLILIMCFMSMLVFEPLKSMKTFE